MADMGDIAERADRLIAGGNRLLAALNAPDLELIGRCVVRRAFARGDVLIEANQPASTAFFIERGVASIVKPEGSNRQTEIGLVGPEGFVGSAIALADSRWPYRTFVQTEHLTAICVPAAALRAAMAESPSFRAAITTAVHVQMVQIAENLVSAAWQPVGSRLARWLLMYRDRVQSHRIEVTHAFMAIMIGAQRTKVTAALHDLESSGAIVASRGLVVIKDAALLQERADGSYEGAVREANRLSRQQR